MAQKSSTKKRVMRAAKTSAKKVGRVAKKAVKKTSSAVKKTSGGAVKKVRKSSVNVRATTARARKLGDAAIVAGAILKQTADVVDTVAQASAARKKSASRSRKSTNKSR